MAKKEGKSKKDLDLKTIYTILSQPKLSFDSAVLKSLEISYGKGDIEGKNVLPSILASGVKYGLQGNKGGKRVAEQFVKGLYAQEINAFNKSIQDEKDTIASIKLENKIRASINNENRAKNKSNAENFRERKENYKAILQRNKEIEAINKNLDNEAKRLKGILKNEANAQLREDIKKNIANLNEKKKEKLQDLEKQYEIQIINEKLDTDYLKSMSVKYFTPAEMNKVIKSNDQVAEIKKIFEKKGISLFEKTKKLTQKEKENLRTENVGLEVNANVEVYDKDKFSRFDFASQVREYDRVYKLYDENLRTKSKRNEFKKKTITNQRWNDGGSANFRAYNFNHFKAILNTLTNQLDEAIAGNNQFILEVEERKMKDFLSANADFIALGSEIDWLDSDYEEKIETLKGLGFSEKDLFENENDIKLNDFSKIDEALGTGYGKLKFRSDYNPYRGDLKDELKATKEKNLKLKEFGSFQNETQVKEVLNTKGLSKLQQLERLKIDNAKEKVNARKQAKEQAKQSFAKQTQLEKEKVIKQARENVAKKLSEIDNKIAGSKITKLEAIKPIAEQRIGMLKKLPVPERTIFKPKKSMAWQLIEPATRATKTPAAKKALRIETKRALQSKNKSIKKK